MPEAADLTWVKTPPPLIPCFFFTCFFHSGSPILVPTKHLSSNLTIYHLQVWPLEFQMPCCRKHFFFINLVLTISQTLGNYLQMWFRMALCLHKTLPHLSHLKVEELNPRFDQCDFCALLLPWKVFFIAVTSACFLYGGGKCSQAFHGRFDCRRIEKIRFVCYQLCEVKVSFHGVNTELESDHKALWHWYQEEHAVNRHAARLA